MWVFHTFFIFKMNKYFIIFAILLFTFNVLDIVSTKIILDEGGFEGNPVARALIEGIGFWWSALIKMIICLFVIGALFWIGIHNPLLAVIALAFAVGVAWAVVCGNVLVIYHYWMTL